MRPLPQLLPDNDEEAAPATMLPGEGEGRWENSQSLDIKRFLECSEARNQSELGEEVESGVTSKDIGPECDPANDRVAAAVDELI